VGQHAKLLHAVFNNQTFGDAVAPNIKQSLGKEAFDYIGSQIDAITNPSQFKDKASGGKLLGFFRGSIVISNLAFRWSSVLIQYVTSPLPFLSEVNPAQLLAVSLEAHQHPLAFVAKAEAESAILRHRQMTAEVAYLEKRVEEGVASKLEKFSQMGMKPLTAVDRFTVAIGWEAVRRNRLAQLRSKNPNAADDILMSTASAFADEVIIKTQPTAEDVYRSPMYRDMDNYKQLVLQFTQPLNVIWNNIRNDVPQAMREAEFHRYMGFIAAYALSGVANAAIGILRGRGPDDPDEEGAWAKYWIHASTAQFTDAIPLVGNIVTSLTRRAITGDSGYVNDNNTPATSALIQALSMSFSEEPDMKKIILNAATGIGMMAGAPVRGSLDVVQLGESIFGSKE